MNKVRFGDKVLGDTGPILQRDEHGDVDLAGMKDDWNVVSRMNSAKRTLDDDALIEKMHGLINACKARSAWDAALMVADEAKSRREPRSKPESIAKRLVKKFKGID